MRIDLAGGTTDIPPLFLFHYPAPVINAGISVFATVTIERSARTIIHSVDQDVTAEFSNPKKLDWKKYRRLELIIRLVKAFDIKENIKVTVKSDAPHGSGLGASSALAIAITAGLARWTGKKLSEEEMVNIAKSVETQTINVPTGYQDYWGAVYGDLRSYQIALDGKVVQRSIPGLKKSKKEFAKYLNVIYTGTPHFSGTNNWQLFQKHINGDKKMAAFFDQLKQNALSMEVALGSGSIKRIAHALHQDWKTRKSMLPGMTTPAIEKFTKEFLKMGGLGFRVCGAGGGGCAIALIDPKHKDKLSALVQKMNMRILPAKIVDRGVVVSME
jgi:D-glycero-alpha-D-manno-heptose-7-phosphate kinase